MNVYSHKMRHTKHLPIAYLKLEYLFPLLYACKTAGRDKLFHSETTEKCFCDLKLPVAYGIHSLGLRCKHSTDILVSQSPPVAVGLTEGQDDCAWLGREC